MNCHIKVFLLLTCTCLLIMTACNQNSNGKEDVFGNVIIETEDGFLFEGIDWMTKRDVIGKELSDSVYNDTLNRLEINEKNGDEQRITLYYFQEGHFYTGEYIALFNKKSDYESYLSEIKNQAESYITVHQPMGDSLNELSNNTGVSWEGNDKSYFRISISEQEDKYLISFMVEAPKGLKKE